MPHKIPFEIEAFSGEDERYKAKELNAHGPLVKGWQSQRFCLYPQELVIALNQRSRIRKIQILSHQFLIASKVEFYVGDISPSLKKTLSNSRFTRLGYVALSDNSATQFQARELKSVHVDAAGTFVRLIIHKNYVNQYNLYNQVGIIALNVIGDPAPLEEIDAASRANSLRNNNNNNNTMVSPLDDLAFDMYQDPEVARLIRRLNEKKREAVDAEKFDAAKIFKETILKLQKVGVKLGRYEIEKREAIEAEDYDKAKQKKDQMENFRSAAFRELNLNRLLSLNLEDVPGRAGAPSSDDDVIQPQQRSKLGAGSTPVLPPIGTPPPPDFNADGRQIDPDERPLPTVSKQVPNEKQKLSDSSTPDPSTSPQPAKLPPLDEVDAANDEAAAAEQPVAPPDHPEALSEKDAQEMLAVLDIVDESLVEKLCSKYWQMREVGLREIQEFLRDSYGPSTVSREQGRNASRAMVLVLKRLLKDKVHVVFSSTWDFLRFLVTEYNSSHKLGKTEIVYVVERAAPVLLARVGDKNQRNAIGPQQVISLLAQIPDVKSIQVIQNLLQQPIKFNSAPKITLGRLELLEELVKRFGVGPESGFDLETVVKLTRPLVEHPSSPVRDVCYRLIVDLYKEYGKPVKGCLPGDDDRIRKILTWRRIFEQFDRIDGKPTKAELAARAAEAEKQKQRQIQELQSELEALRNMQPKSPTKEEEDAVEAAADDDGGRDGEEEGREEEPSEVPSNLCVFCGEEDEAFGQGQSLDMHYWESCPLLMRCASCKQVVEISGIADHLVHDCESTTKFVRCERCRVAVVEDELEAHRKTNDCLHVEEGKLLCPLCEEIVDVGEKEVAEHYMGDGENACAKNPRRNLGQSRG